MNHELMGVGVALITPFTADYSIDFDGLTKLIAFVSEEGTDYLVVNGTTGESATTTAEEKAQLLKFVKENNPKNLPIVYGLGGNNTTQVLEALEQTDLSGVAALLSVCPYYIKPSQEGIYQHYKAIADASPIPVILYNVPGRTVTSIAHATVLRLAEHPNIIGLKDASCSMEQAMQLVKDCPKDFLLLSGDDNLVTPQISIGYHGVISVIGNGFPKEFGEMTWAALRGDFRKAASYQLRFLDFDTLLYVEANPVGIKKVCEIKGICGSNVRLPLLPASADLGEKLEKSMRAEGFWN